MAKRQYLGIKFPFEAQDIEKYYVDLNKTKRDNVRSQILHVMFTPKGQKIRDPEFGTNLIHFIFEPNDEVTWDKIKNEASNAINTYVENATLNDINILKSEENGNEVFVRIDYSVKEGNIVTSDSVITKL